MSRPRGPHAGRAGTPIEEVWRRDRQERRKERLARLCRPEGMPLWLWLACAATYFALSTLLQWPLWALFR